MTKSKYGEERHVDETGNLHREDGPAVIRSDGTQLWFFHGNRHREDGPAYIYSDGTQEWYLHGNVHREDGPAIIHSDGRQQWWVHGKKLDDIQVFVIESKLLNERNQMFAMEVS